MVRFDRESEEAPADALGREILAAVDRALPAATGAVIEDYGKGVLSPQVAYGSMQRFEAAGLPVVVDPKDTVSPYRGAAVLKPNLREAEVLSGVAIRCPSDLARAAQRLRSQLGGGAVGMTRGVEGMTVFDGEGPGVDVETVPRDVFDVQGAGDTVIAALSLALRAGATLLEAAVIANAAAGVVVGKVGTATASVDEVRAILPAAIAASGVSS